MTDSPELAAAKRLLDAAKVQGFTFARIAPGPDGPLRGVRETVEFLDEIYVGGCGRPDSCTAIRRGLTESRGVARRAALPRGSGSSLTVASILPIRLLLVFNAY
jgi:hypothetical protein